MATGPRRAPRSFVIVSLIVVGVLSAVAGFAFGDMMGGTPAAATEGAPSATDVPPSGGAAQDELAGSSWRLTGWSISAVELADTVITAVFADGNIGGNSGVNSYSGPYTVAAAGSLTIGEVAMTMMAGPEPAMQAESAYHELLRQVTGYRLADDTLTLLDSNGNELLIFTRE